MTKKYIVKDARGIQREFENPFEAIRVQPFIRNDEPTYYGKRKNKGRKIKSLTPSDMVQATVKFSAKKLTKIITPTNSYSPTILTLNHGYLASMEENINIEVEGYQSRVVSGGSRTSILVRGEDTTLNVSGFGSTILLLGDKPEANIVNDAINVTLLGEEGNINLVGADSNIHLASNSSKIMTKGGNNLITAIGEGNVLKVIGVGNVVTSKGNNVGITNVGVSPAITSVGDDVVICSEKDGGGRILTVGNRVKISAGLGTTIQFGKKYDNNISFATGIIGKGGLLPHVTYHMVKGEIQRVYSKEINEDSID